MKNPQYRIHLPGRHFDAAGHAEMTTTRATAPVPARHREPAAISFFIDFVVMQGVFAAGRTAARVRRLLH